MISGLCAEGSSVYNVNNKWGRNGTYSNFALISLAAFPIVTCEIIPNSSQSHQVSLPANPTASLDLRVRRRSCIEGDRR